MDIFEFLVFFFSALAFLLGALSFFYFGRYILGLMKARSAWGSAFAGFVLLYIGYSSWFASFLTGDDRIIVLSILIFLAGTGLMAYGGFQIYSNLRRMGG